MMMLNINNWVFDEWGQWPTSSKIVVALIFCGVLGMLGYYGLIKSRVTQYQFLLAREHALKREFETKQHHASQLPAYRKQMLILNAHFNQIQKSLSRQNEIPALLEEISNIGVSSGLTFELISPLAVVSHDFYSELPIKMVVVGQFQQFEYFLSRIAQMNRLVTIHNFVLARLSSNQQEGQDRDALTLTMVAKIYQCRS